MEGVVGDGSTRAARGWVKAAAAVPCRRVAAQGLGYHRPSHGPMRTTRCRTSSEIATGRAAGVIRP